MLFIIIFFITILLKPPLKTNTILLWFLPFIILIFGSIFVIRFLKSNYK